MTRLSSRTHRMPTPFRALAIAALSLGAACHGDRPRADSASAGASRPPSSVSRGEWTITPRGLGPLHAGMTRAEAEAVLGGSLAVDGDSAWANCAYLRGDRLPPGVRVMVEGGTIARVEVDSGTTATADGARIGDGEERIKALYAGHVATTPQKYTDGHYLTVTPAVAADSLFRIVFEADSGRVRAYRAGRLPAVEYVEGCA